MEGCSVTLPFRIPLFVVLASTFKLWRQSKRVYERQRGSQRRLSAVEGSGGSPRADRRFGEEQSKADKKGSWGEEGGATRGKRRGIGGKCQLLYQFFLSPCCPEVSPSLSGETAEALRRDSLRCQGDISVAVTGRRLHLQGVSPSKTVHRTVLKFPSCEAPSRVSPP